MKNIKIKIYAKKNSTKDGKRKFTTYKTDMKLWVKLDEKTLAKYPKLIDLGEMGESVRIKRSVDVKFAKSIPAETISKIVGECVLTCPSTKVSSPKRYEIKIKQDEKTGETKEVYPYVYISEIVDVEKKEREASQDDFILGEDEDSESADVTL